MSASIKQKPDDTLVVKISGQGMEQIYFKIKANSTFQRMMERYAQRNGIRDLKSVNFLLNGESIRPDQTPQQMGMIEGDEIEVVGMQIGGGQN